MIGPSNAAPEQFRRTWWLPGIVGRAFVILRRDLDEDEKPTAVPWDLRERLERALCDPLLGQTLTDLGRAVDPNFCIALNHGLIPVQRRYLAERLTATFQRGQLLVVEVPEAKQSSMRKEEPPPAPPPPAKKAKTKTWIEFQFVFPDQTPVSDVDYVFEDPEGLQEPGTLGSKGNIERRDVPEGTYAVILKGIEQVAWKPGKARCDEKIKITAQTAGFSYGARAKVNIYREFRETEAEIIQSLQGKVEDDRIEVEWKYDYTASDARKTETGLARFIAEVELEQGKHWAKSQQPLQLELRSIEKLQWAVPRLEAGGTAEVKIETLGCPDGAEVKLELWRFHWEESKKVADLKSVTVAGGKATARCAYAKRGSADVTQSGEYFVAAKIDGPVVRTAKSGLLWCVYSEEEEAEAQPAA